MDVPVRQLRWHWLWYGPAFLAAFLYSLMSLGWFWRQASFILEWSLPLLWSPAAYLWLIAMEEIIRAPVVWAITIQQRVRAAATLQWVELAGWGTLSVYVVVRLVVAYVLAWGSFPIEFNPQGYERIRMLPFLPWPTRALF